MAFYVWGEWCNSTASTLTTANYNATAWIKWTVATTDNTISSTDTWISWTDTGTSTYVLGEPYVDPRSAEQIAADEARFASERERVAAKAAQAEAERKVARDRARALLLSMLNVKQREQLEREKFFEIVSQSQKRYRIRQGTHGNVRLLNEGGKEVTRYCGQPHGVPDEDAMLAQKLQLEHDEQAFLRIANATRL